MVCDNTVTLNERYDFFLVSQKANQGTVSPTSFNIIEDTTGTPPDIHQKLAYALTHLYYNWPVISLNYLRKLTVLMLKFYVFFSVWMMLGYPARACSVPIRPQVGLFDWWIGHAAAEWNFNSSALLSLKKKKNVLSFLCYQLRNYLRPLTICCSREEEKNKIQFLCNWLCVLGNSIQVFSFN